MRKQAAEKQPKYMLVAMSRSIANRHQSGCVLVSKDCKYVADCNVRSRVRQLNLECKGNNLKETYGNFQTAWYFDYFIRNIENIHQIVIT